MSLDPISIGLQFVGKIADRIWPDPAAKAKGLLELEQLRQTGELAYLAAETELMKGQIAINTEEAKSASIFVAGWRPWIGWVCGVAFAYHFILQPLLVFLMASAGHKVELPAFDMDALNTVLLGMLGLGGMRSFEKFKGVTK
jgi:hypothetical protein